MKISTKGSYGILAMMDLAAYAAKGELVTIASISLRQGISKNYLEQVITSLRKAGYIKGIKGAQGGYTLAKPAEEITAGDMLKILEGATLEISMEESVQSGSGADVLQRVLWGKLNTVIDETLNGITLKDLSNAYWDRQNALMYYI